MKVMSKHFVNRTVLSPFNDKTSVAIPTSYPAFDTRPFLSSLLAVDACHSRLLYSVENLLDFLSLRS